MVNGSYSKKYPKKFNSHTTIDSNGFTVYWRRDGRKVIVRGQNIDNRWVVPYNIELLIKYNAHINVELCAKTKVIKYMFKYIHKGPDKATAVLEVDSRKNVQHNDNVCQENDEVKQYIDCRYISAPKIFVMLTMSSTQTFKFACNALGLLEDDNEWHEVLEEASVWASGHQLRHLFASMLTSCEVTDPLVLWDTHWRGLSDDLQGGFYFVYGSGGNGKTYLWKKLVNRLRMEGRLVLSVASSSIATLLLPGGRTAQSRFQIPLKLDETSTCSIAQKTDIAKLIKKIDLVIWDEAPMAHRHVFEAVDRIFKDY
ncbi:uncharacterized protein LOC143885840 [Tasmannia lanceolata]|uniref:uncharacterized protein LOC143885840 n=1 Tax=Tasmannia lanceolata TaxID=3420 RepID=UPI004062CD67